jgi:hypothetical protein
MRISLLVTITSLLACGGAQVARPPAQGGTGGSGGEGGTGACVPSATPSCNGMDDDCDNQVDEADELAQQLTEIAQPGPYKNGDANCHAPGLKGICGEGKWVCTSAGMVCDIAFFNEQPVKEICRNGLDDNCSGEMDEGPSCQ